MKRPEAMITVRKQLEDAGPYYAQQVAAKQRELEVANQAVERVLRQMETPAEAAERSIKSFADELARSGRSASEQAMLVDRYRRHLDAISPAAKAAAERGERNGGGVQTSR